MSSFLISIDPFAYVIDKILSTYVTLVFDDRQVINLSRYLIERIESQHDYITAHYDERS